MAVLPQDIVGHALEDVPGGGFVEIMTGRQLVAEVVRLRSLVSDGRAGGIEDAAQILRAHVHCECYRRPEQTPQLVGQEHWGDCLLRIYEAIQALPGAKRQ